MIAAQVSEHRHIKTHRIHAPLRQRVRGHFHRDALRPLAHIVSQQAMHADGVRCGVGAGLQRATTIDPDKAIAERAYQCAFFSRVIQGMRNPVRGRGLAIGAGDAHHPQFFRGCAIHCIGQPSRFVAQVRHGEIRHLPDIVPDKMLRLPRVPGQKLFVNHRIRALCDCRRNELSAIIFFTGVGNESIATLNGTAVRHQACDRYF